MRRKLPSYWRRLGSKGFKLLLSICMIETKTECFCTRTAMEAAFVGRRKMNTSQRLSRHTHYLSGHHLSSSNEKKQGNCQSNWSKRYHYKSKFARCAMIQSWPMKRGFNSSVAISTAEGVSENNSNFQFRVTKSTNWNACKGTGQQRQNSKFKNYSKMSQRCYRNCKCSKIDNWKKATS